MASRSYEHVFTPVAIKGIDFKNRIETPPTLPFLASADGFATQELVEYHRAFARGGAGIVTVGDSGISLAGKNHEGQLNLGTDAAIPGLNKLYEGIRALRGGGVHRAKPRGPQYIRERPAPLGRFRDSERVSRSRRRPRREGCPSRRKG